MAILVRLYKEISSAKSPFSISSTSIPKELLVMLDIFSWAEFELKKLEKNMTIKNNDMHKKKSFLVFS